MDLNNMKNLEVSSCFYFKQHYNRIWHTYKRYGECVLNVDLGDTENDIREILIKSERERELLERIEKFWKDRYQVIVMNPSDIPRVLELDMDEILVEESKHASPDSLALVSKEFFKELSEKASKENLVYVLNSEILYVIKLDTDGIIIQDSIPTNRIIR